MNPLTWRGAALRATERSAKLPILKREGATFSAQEAEPVSFSFMLIAEMATSQAELLSTKRTTGELLLCEKSDTRSTLFWTMSATTVQMKVTFLKFAELDAFVKFAWFLNSMIICVRVRGIPCHVSRNGILWTVQPLNLLLGWKAVSLLS